MSGEVIIDAKQLMKRYGSFTAVNGVSFQVYKGEIFGLLGPNGAGKTTTMEMIEGLRRPDGGNAIVAGFDTQRELGKLKQVIGIQLQSTSLFDLLKVKEIIKMYASFYKYSVPIQPLLESVNLVEKMNDRVKNLSGGQKQRLAIALALVNDPAIVFLDEPTTGLDPQARRALWDIIVKLKEQGKSIVLSTHYMDEANILCDRICLMDRGEVIALDSPRGLIHALDTESAIEFRLRDEQEVPREVREQLRNALEAHQDVIRVEAHHDIIVMYTNNLQAALLHMMEIMSSEQLAFVDLQTRMATLEDVFIQMTGRSLRDE